MTILVWISPMGSRPSFCTKVSKFLTSAIIKWWFSTSKGLRKMTTWYCYKMKIDFYHEVTWRGNSTTTKWRLVFIFKLLEGDTPPLQNEDLFLYVFIISFATKWDWVFTCCLPKGNFPCYKMRLGFYMLSSDGQILLLQNDFRFLKVFQLPKRWKLIKCNSQAVDTKCLAHPHFFILI